MNIKHLIHLLVLPFALVVSEESISAQVQHSVIKEGIRLDISMMHIDKNLTNSSAFKEGDDVRFRFEISDTLTNEPLTGAFPAAWMDKSVNTEDIDCGKIVSSFIEGGLLSRPELNLNIYYVLTLNDDNTINVVDPLFGFGGSQLLTQIQLPGSGYDWVLKKDQSELYVSIPSTNQVCVINTTDLKIESIIDLDGSPMEMALQNDGQYLWVGYEKEVGNSTGVTVIDVDKRLIEKVIATGKGYHELELGKDNKFIYVSNQMSQTISIIDIQKLIVINEINCQGTPSSMAFTALTNKLVYINQDLSTISSIDATNHMSSSSISAEIGIRKVRVSPKERFAFGINPLLNTVDIIDLASFQIVQTADVEGSPDDISFTDELAYVSHLGSEIIWMIPLDAIGKKGQPVPLVDFNGGENPPQKGVSNCAAKGIVQAPGANAVLVNNYKDKSVYYYSEGMAAPMGHFNTYGKSPKAVQVIDKSIEEVSPGIYETTARLRSPGEYQLSIFMDVPRIIDCFSVVVEPNQELNESRMLSTLGPISVEFQPTPKAVKVGEKVQVKFSLEDLKTHKDAIDLTDVSIMTMSTSGAGHSPIAVSQSEVKGMYETELEFNESGLYYLYVACPSRKLGFDNPQFLVLYISDHSN